MSQLAVVMELGEGEYVARQKRKLESETTPPPTARSASSSEASDDDSPDLADGANDVTAITVTADAACVPPPKVVVPLRWYWQIPRRSFVAFDIGFPAALNEGRIVSRNELGEVMDALNDIGRAHDVRLGYLTYDIFVSSHPQRPIVMMPAYVPLLYAGNNIIKQTLTSRLIPTADVNLLLFVALQVPVLSFVAWLAFLLVIIPNNSQEIAMRGHTGGAGGGDAYEAHIIARRAAYASVVRLVCVFVLAFSSHGLVMTVAYALLGDNLAAHNAPGIDAMNAYLESTVNPLYAGRRVKWVVKEMGCDGSFVKPEDADDGSEAAGSDVCDGGEESGSVVTSPQHHPHRHRRVRTPCTLLSFHWCSRCWGRRGTPLTAAGHHTSPSASPSPFSGGVNTYYLWAFSYGTPTSNEPVSLPPRATSASSASGSSASASAGISTLLTSGLLRTQPSIEALESELVPVGVKAADKAAAEPRSSTASSVSFAATTTSRVSRLSVASASRSSTGGDSVTPYSSAAGDSDVQRYYGHTAASAPTALDGATATDASAAPATAGSTHPRLTRGASFADTLAAAGRAARRTIDSFSEGAATQFDFLKGWAADGAGGLIDPASAASAGSTDVSDLRLDTEKLDRPLLDVSALTIDAAAAVATSGAAAQQSPSKQQPQKRGAYSTSVVIRSPVITSARRRGPQMADDAF